MAKLGLKRSMFSAVVPCLPSVTDFSPVPCLPGMQEVKQYSPCALFARGPASEPLERLEVKQYSPCALFARGPASEPFPPVCIAGLLISLRVSSCDCSNKFSAALFANRFDIMAGMDVDVSLIEFLAAVDLPRVNPQELVVETAKFLNDNGIMENWHLVGLTMSAFKKESFKDAQMIGAVF